MHVHTAFSFYAHIGGAMAQPSDAYRFAQGEAIKVQAQDVKIQ